MATINGTAGNDTLTGTAGSDTVSGFGGNDSVTGSGGIDWVEGGLGNDTVRGGSGQDSLVFREAGAANADLLQDYASNYDNIQLDVAFFTAIGTRGRFAAGDARFWSSSSGTAHDANDRIVLNTSTGQLWYDADGNGSGAAQLIATLPSGRTVIASDLWVFGTPSGGGQTINGTSGDDSLIGGPGNDTINGFAGEDTIDGGPGTDSMAGGAHADTYFVDNSGDIIVELEGGGFDTVNASASYVLPEWVNHLTLVGTAAINGFGNDLANVITGNSGHNTLNGDAGDDTIIGGDGDDRIEGDLIDDVHGNDSIDGGAGDDFIRGGNGDDTMIGGAGSDAFGIDSGFLDFEEYGGNDSIDGGDGVDGISFGTEGVSTTHAVIINLTAGTYTIAHPAGQLNGVVINVENVTGSGFDDDITGTDGPNAFGDIGGGATIRGLGGDDFFHAEGGNQRWDGGAGDDTMEGSPGSDTLAGGLGNDVLGGDHGGFPSIADSFLFDVAPGPANADLITDFASGSDRIVLDGSTHASSGASGTFATGDARFWSSGTGAAHDADDRVIYNTSSGELWYDADGNGAGARQLIATLQGTPNLAATDIAIINGSGGGGGQVVNGTSGSDTLTGTSGNDTINGLGGNDLFQAASTGGADVINGGAGFDAIEFASRATSAVVVDFGAGTITGGSSGSISFTGIERVVAGNFNDSLGGTAGGQTLNGLGGADALWGAGGVDVLWGGAGADTFVFREVGSANADSVRDWASGSDKVALDNSPMSALGTTGNFAAGDARFWSSSTGTAHDANDRVIYNTSTGSLYYDADGSGAGAAQLIATFQGAPGVAATDITVI